MIDGVSFSGFIDCVELLVQIIFADASESWQRVRYRIIQRFSIRISHQLFCPLPLLLQLLDFRLKLAYLLQQNIRYSLIFLFLFLLLLASSVLFRLCFDLCIILLFAVFLFHIRYHINFLFRNYCGCYGLWIQFLLFLVMCLKSALQYHEMMLLNTIIIALCLRWQLNLHGTIINLFDGEIIRFRGFILILVNPLQSAYRIMLWHQALIIDLLFLFSFHIRKQHVLQLQLIHGMVVFIRWRYNLELYAIAIFVLILPFTINFQFALCQIGVIPDSLLFVLLVFLLDLADAIVSAIDELLFLDYHRLIELLLLELAMHDRLGIAESQICACEPDCTVLLLFGCVFYSCCLIHIIFIFTFLSLCAMNPFHITLHYVIIRISLYIQMKCSINTVLLVLVCLISASISTKVEADLQLSDFIDNSMAFLNKLFQLHNLPISLQVQNCLNQTKYSDQISQVLQQFARNGSVESSGLLPKVLSSAYDKLHKTLPSNIITCIQGSNDFRILMHHTGIKPQDYLSKFQKFTKMNFLDVHYKFTNMSALLNDTRINETQKYQKLASILNDLAKLVYYTNGKLADDPWKLRAEQVETLTEYFGISVSNGILGVVSSRYPFQLSSSVLAGAYDKIGRGRVDNLVQTFPALNIEASFGSHSYSNYVQQVDMKHGSMTHSFGNPGVSVQYTYYTLQNLPHIFYTKFTVVAHQDGDLNIKNVHRAPETLIGLQKYQEEIDTSVGIFDILSTVGKTKTGKLTLVISSMFKFDGKSNPRVLHQDWDEDMHLQKFRQSLIKGDKFTFSIITCLLSSQNHDDPINEAIRLVIRASSITDLVAGHNKKWEELWQSDIIIQGNDVDQKHVRSMLYHCYSFTSGFKSYGLSPMGLSGLGYNGHVFWDMDLWMYPAILALKPSLAKSLINYRYERLQAAKQNAFLNGYEGAMFPWESSKSGSQECPVWALSGPLQHHISGCVAFGAWNYYLVTQDKQWLIEKGYPIIENVAKFFASRVELGTDGMYHINNVVGADEWAQNIDDNAFTNGVAKVSLSVANKAAKILNLPTNPKWDQISSKIVILKFANNVTKQHATYNGQNIKQADVNLLAYPLDIITKKEDILRDLQYYEVRVPEGGTPAMTYSIFSLLYSRLKNATKGYQVFKDSFIPYIRKPFGAFAETKGGNNPYFMTGAGGVLQSVIFGFGGYHIGDQGLYTTNQTLPAQWKKLTIKTEAKVSQIPQKQPLVVLD